MNSNSRQQAAVMALRFAASEWADGDIEMAERLCHIVWERVETTGHEFIDEGNEQ